MKTFIVLLSSFLLSFTALSQSCLPEGITFTTQAQIDNFQVDYPGCTEIEGDLKIEGDDINNLSGLSVLTSIGGNLIIGPDNYWEPALTSLAGLNNVTQIAGNVWIGSNEILETFDGLEGLTYIGGRLDIEFNPALTSLTGLVNLASIEGALDISGNDLLVNMMGLNNLTLIGGDLIIAYHDNLNSLTGLENINSGSIHDLYIYYNPSLSACEVQSVCDYLTSPNGKVFIQHNATGCDNPPEVASGCGITLPCLPFGSFIFNTQADIDNFKIYYPDCHNLNGIVAIHGNDIDNLDGLDEVTSIGDDLVIQYNSVLNNVLGLRHLKSIGKTLEIAGNDMLTSLSGLDSIDAGTITDLNIFENPVLSTCEVQSICDYLASPNGTINIYENAVGCNSQLEIESACAVGLADNSLPEDHLTIYPNPASEVLFIESAEEITSVTVYDSRGITMEQWNNLTVEQTSERSDEQARDHILRVPLDGLAPGIYLVRVDLRDVMINKKIIVKH